MNTQRLKNIRVAQGYHLLPVKPGMQLELHEKVGDENNQRIWRFKWLVLKVKKPKHADGTFIIRWKVAGHTIEKIYPLSFPKFEKVILLDEYKIRRAKLYYLRDKVGKGAKLKSLLTQSEKGVDLLQLAKEEIEALQKAMEEEVVQEEAQTETVDETSEAVVQEESQEVAEETPAEETTEEVKEENVEEKSEESSDDTTEEKTQAS